MIGWTVFFQLLAAIALLPAVVYALFEAWVVLLKDLERKPVIVLSHNVFQIDRRFHNILGIQVSMDILH